jgi:hypothetical protein
MSPKPHAGSSTLCWLSFTQEQFVAMFLIKDSLQCQRLESFPEEKC